MPEETIRLRYDPLTLPTAQHRAGLAGLVVHLETLRGRRLAPLPSWSVTEDGQVEVTLSRAALQLVFDDLYEGFWEERLARSKPQGSSFRNLHEQVVQVKAENGKTRDEKRFAYEVVTPRAPFLASLHMPPPWLKLWREAIWATLRGVPKTRGPYEDRAAKRPCGEAERMWSALARWETARQRGRSYTVDVVSSLFVGAQAINAEGVPFVGTPDHNLLLHFWPVVMGVGEARRLRLENGRVADEPAGYVFTIPDVSEVQSFADEYRKVVASLSQEMAGIRPRAAVYSVPHEGGLEYLHHLTRLAQATAQRQEDIEFTVSGFEVVHLAKEGNNINLRGSGRVPASRKLAEDYGQLRQRFSSPIFRAQLITNLLKERSWHVGFDRVFSFHPRELFLESPGQFVFDVQRKFRDERLTS